MFSWAHLHVNRQRMSICSVYFLEIPLIFQSQWMLFSEIPCIFPFICPKYYLFFRISGCYFPQNNVYFPASVNINLFRLFPPKYRLFFESVVLFSRNTEIQNQWMLFPRNTIYFSESVDVISPKYRLFFRVSGCYFTEIPFIFQS